MKKHQVKLKQTWIQVPRRVEKSGGGLELKKNFVLTTHMIKSFVIISTSATMKFNFKITELLA